MNKVSINQKEIVIVIIPVYNEEECLGELMKRLLVLRQKASPLEVNFLFVNDGSKDGTFSLLENYARQYSFVQVIHLSRNFGHQVALTAGVDHASADYIAILDADLQDPPELILSMVQKAKEGYDVVYGQRISRKGESFLKKWSAKLFYKLLSQLCDVEIPVNTGDFRLISRRVCEVLKEMREPHRFIRGMIPWIGFDSVALEYHRDERFAGKTKYSFKKMFLFALNAIFSFSNVPLRIATYLGFFIVGLGGLGALFMVYLRLFTTYTVPGITAVLVTILIMGGMQLALLGVIGSYLGRNFEASKKRPLYVIKDKKNL